MIRPFRHIDVATVSEATRMGADYRGKARFVAGGTDILGLLKTEAEAVYPELLINIKKIPGLDRIEIRADGARIGALTRLADIAHSPLIGNAYPILAQAAEAVGMPQIRNMGTIGGNLAQETRCWYYRYPQDMGGRIRCRRKGGKTCPALTGDNRYHALFGGKQCVSVCPSDTAVALAALDARIQIAGPNGDRLVEVTDFYHPLGNALAPGELITEIRIPPPPAGNRQTFVKYRLRGAIDFAVVSVGLLTLMQDGTCSLARIVLGAVGPGPYRPVKAEAFLCGKAVGGETPAAAAAMALGAAVPLSRNAYKIEIAKTLIKRALLICSGEVIRSSTAN